MNEETNELWRMIDLQRKFFFAYLKGRRIGIRSQIILIKGKKIYLDWNFLVGQAEKSEIEIKVEY